MDSGAFIAFLDASDRQNGAAVALFESPPPRIVTSALVVSETYSWFLHRLGEEAARRFRGCLARLPALEINERGRFVRTKRSCAANLLFGEIVFYFEAEHLRDL